MAWFYMTPIVYSIDMVPTEYRGIFLINPMTSIIMFYREILYYKKAPDFSFFGNIVLYSIIMIFIGYFVFERLQKSFAEEL